MVRCIATCFVLLLFCATPIDLRGPLSSFALAQSPTLIQQAVDDATAKPSTQPDGASTPAEGAAGKPEGVQSSRVYRLLTGKETLSPNDAVLLQTWVGLARDLIYTAIGLIPRIFVALIFLLIFWIAYRTIRRVLLGSMKNASVDSSIRDLLSAILKWGILGFGLVIACNQVGIQITALLTGVSLIGLAIGFAAQESLANFIAGIVIFWDKPFKVGDWIEIDTRFAKVSRITFRSTRMLNLDGTVLIMPNTQMLSNRVENHTTNPINRVRIPVGISYRSSIDDARKALLEICHNDSRICVTPSPEVVVVGLNASSVDLELRVWVADESIEHALVHEYLEKAKKSLDAAKVEIPFPHLQLFLEETAALRTLAARGA